MLDCDVSLESELFDPNLSAVVKSEYDGIAGYGGHVGFITGSNPLQPRYWLEQRILQHLSEFGR